MYSTTRALFTLLGAGIAGFLLWLATQLNVGSNGGYWAYYGIIAAAGLTLALAQLFGGWTKWGWPRMSAAVFLLGFLPALILGVWVIVAHQPNGSWLHGHVLSWSSDLGVRDFVKQTLTPVVGPIAFGLGLLLGFTFDTTGPRRRVETITHTEPVPVAAPTPVPVEGAPARTADEPLTAERTAGADGGENRRSRRNLLRR